jgi:hypothetical protein
VIAVFVGHEQGVKVIPFGADGTQTIAEFTGGKSGIDENAASTTFDVDGISLAAATQ